MNAVGIWRYDLSDKALTLSAEAMRILEIDNAGIGQASYDTLLSRIHPDDREAVSQAYERLLVERRASCLECRLLLAGGRIKHISQSLEPLFDAGGKPSCLVGALLDITQQRELQQQLDDASLELAKAARIRSDYLGRVNQDIHDAITGVLGTTELLRETRLSPDQRSAIEHIINSGKALLDQSNAVYDLSLIDSGQLKFESVRFDLEKVAHKQFMSLARQANEKGLELILDYPLECPRLFYGDPRRIGQILGILFNNGVRYTEVGFVRLSVNLSTDITPLRLEIADSGKGIDTRKLNGLFEATQESGDVGDTVPWGLGLKLTHALIRLMGGRIVLESAPSKGTHITIELDLQVAESMSVSTPAGRFSGNRVLLFQEQHESALALTRLLDCLGLETDCLSDSEAVLPHLLQAIADGRPYELAILDEPHFSSVSMVLGRAIRQLPELKHLRMVALTSQGHRGDAEAFHRAGFDAYINKPVLATTLAELVKTLLEREAADAWDEVVITSHLLEHNAEARTGRHHFLGRVLLVENDPASRHVASSMLDSLGLTVDMAENGLHAILLSNRIDYDIIFMEYKMPDMGLIEAVHLIREQEQEHQHPMVPIIALTPNTTQRFRQECLQAGLSDLITKPYTKFDFVSALQQWLAVQNKPALPDVGELERSMEATIDLGVLEKLNEEMAGDFKVVMEAILDEIAVSLRKLGSDLPALPRRDLAKLTRGLISLSENMGAMRLKRMASDLEQAAAQGFLQDPGPGIMAMQREFESVKRFLKEYGY